MTRAGTYSEAQRGRCEITRVETAPLRGAVLSSRYTIAEVARALGWRDGYGRVDGQRLKRRLGIVPYKDGSGVWRRTKHVEYATALEIIDALGRDPWEFDL